ncbi:hypothetical protein [Aquipseudomonas alcaligenes]|uniref:Uncharacterized protein n=1 Tax=Aquipseudomonas alcaligenes TaxID=43263 RepID=A0A1N6WN32_AQUAC|nr:hypothetical protein [Pseudomonas alcaligenes]SIQ91456.1 hypothetical protein SAMN05878282_11081 [Pseudomonas alcaligenes]
MTSKTAAAILGLSVVAASATYSVPLWINEFNNQNIIETTVGSVRLGKIYNENLKAKLVIKNSENGDIFIEVDEDADRIYKEAVQRLEQLVEASNKDVKKAEDKLTVGSASFKQGMTVTLNIYAAYRSEFQPVYSLMLDETVTTAGVGARVNRVLQQAQEHCDKAVKLFQSEGKLLKVKKVAS